MKIGCWPQLVQGCVTDVCSHSMLILLLTGSSCALEEESSPPPGQAGGTHHVGSQPPESPPVSPQTPQQVQLTGTAHTSVCDPYPLVIPRCTPLGKHLPPYPISLHWPYISVIIHTPVLCGTIMAIVWMFWTLQWKPLH